MSTAARHGIDSDIDELLEDLRGLGFQSAKEALKPMPEEEVLIEGGVSPFLIEGYLLKVRLLLRDAYISRGGVKTLRLSGLWGHGRRKKLTAKTYEVSEEDWFAQQRSKPKKSKTMTQSSIVESVQQLNGLAPRLVEIG